MSYVSAVLISLFLSSVAEARHGATDYRYRGTVWQCNNCHVAGLSLRPYLPTGAYMLYNRKGYKPPIWPPLPTKGVPYLR